MKDIHPQEWHDKRRRGIGGSDWYHLIPDSKGCGRKLWYMKTGIEPDHPKEITGPMIRGNKMEHLVANEYTERTGFSTQRREKFRRRNLPAWWIGNIDRAIIGDAYLEYMTPGVLECKTVNQWRLRQILNDEFPAEWVYQVHHYMHLTGWDWSEIAILEPTNWEFHTRIIEKDQDIIDEMLRAGDNFWYNVKRGLIIEGLKPSDARCQKCEYRGGCHGAALFGVEPEMPDGIEDDNSEALVSLIGPHIQLNDLIKEAKESLDIIREDIKAYLETPKKVRSAGAKVTYTGTRLTVKKEV